MISLLIDGRPTNCLDPLDRGFQYGDGVFSTLPVHAGVPLFLDRHLDRLRRDALRLGIPFPSRSDLMADISTLLSHRQAGILKIQITRGSGGRGYRPPEHPTAMRVIALHPPVTYPEEYAVHGIEARYCEIRLGLNPALAGIKHMNRLEQVLARSEWSDPSIVEGLMLDYDGHVIEGTMSNVFVVSKGCILTPRLDRCGVNGVMRSLVLEAAGDLGWPLEEARLTPDGVAAAEEVFLTNSVIGLWPVRDIEGQRFTIGKATRKIGEWLRYKTRQAGRSGSSVG
jgi:4-amino-4-deoxychorismate lyase